MLLITLTIQGKNFPEINIKSYKKVGTSYIYNIVSITSLPNCRKRKVCVTCLLNLCRVKTKK
ncbi:hypothetical protein KUTeg_007955 [Tegillarca granosa]|uniref:Uncharacterized protein n=1 Tax=Tegillarca granosa TaxID=220873 RepID=A0ABQ9FHN9_TEGGR|nr:hypothetical protein KUTeg_007955 [Tegillarca granosa]